MNLLLRKTTALIRWSSLLSADLKTHLIAQLPLCTEVQLREVIKIFAKEAQALAEIRALDQRALHGFFQSMERAFVGANKQGMRLIRKETERIDRLQEDAEFTRAETNNLPSL